MPYWIVVVGWITKLVLAFLLGLSVWSVALILAKRKQLRIKDDKASFQALKTEVLQSNSPQESLPNELGIRKRFVTLLKKSQPRQVDHLARSFQLEARGELEQHLSTLSTLGSNAPYIGLFGTVLGIIQSFGVLASNDQGGTALIMASLSEALIATAVGLWVAIPAVAATNIFNKKLRDIFRDCESLKETYLASKQS
jgi:biopolymer transport protein TolQ